MTVPLLDALETVHGIPTLAAEHLGAYAASRPHLLLLLAGDPKRHPEALDLAVVLPELLGAFGGRFAAARVAPADEAAVKERFGVRAWPALVHLRHGVFAGERSKMQDWQVYLEQLGSWLREDGAPGGRIATVSTANAGDDA